MNKYYIFLIVFLAFLVFSGYILLNNRALSDDFELTDNLTSEDEIILPKPRLVGILTLEEALKDRRSIRDYSEEALDLADISQLLWSAQGVTDDGFGGRTAPSAGATYPLEIYLAVRDAEQLDVGLYHYQPKNHSLVKLADKNLAEELATISLNQTFISQAPINIIMTAITERTTARYGERGVRYSYLEAGHSAQNIYLQATSLGLGTVVVGAFNDEDLRELLNLDAEEIPLYVIPVGKKL